VDLVYIYGPPGTGKLTVAKQLAALTGYKLFHNHLSIDAVRPVFDFGTEPFWRQVHKIRQDMLEEAALCGVSLIYTSVYNARVLDLVQKRFAGVESNGGKVRLVNLTCSVEVLTARVGNEDRVALNKLTSLEMLQRVLDEDDPYAVIPGRDSLRIDNTDLSPEEVAHRIIDHYGLTPVRSMEDAK
jgi:shikimate kinase